MKERCSVTWTVCVLKKKYPQWLNHPGKEKHHRKYPKKEKKKIQKYKIFKYIK